MEREIANVAAACAMRGFRYMAFPPVVFDAPVEALEPTEWPEPVMPAFVVPEIPVVLAAEPPPKRAVAVSAAPAAVAPRPEPPSLPPPPLASPPPGPRFALLAEVSAQLRQAPP